MVCVVLIHSRIDADSQNAGMAITEFICDGLCQIAVPCFFVISGMLFFRGLDGNVERKLKSRVRTLVVPYLLWNLIGAVLFLIKRTVLSDAFASYSVIEISPLNMLKGFWSYSLMGLDGVAYPFDFTLWFLRDLIVVIPVSVLIYKLFRTSVWLLPFLIFAFGTNLYIPDQFGLVRALCYFYFGGIMQSYLYGATERYRAIPAWLRRGVMIAGPTIFTGWSLANDMLPQWLLDWGTYPVYLLCIVGLVWLFAMLFNGDERIQGSLCMRSLFFIYAAHGLWVTVAGKMVLCVFSAESSAGVLCAYAAKFLLLWYADMLAYAVLQKVWPRCASVLSGGRNG